MELSGGRTSSLHTQKGKYGTCDFCHMDINEIYDREWWGAQVCCRECKETMKARGLQEPF